MAEVFDMNMNDLFNEDSEFIEGFQGLLEDLGINIDSQLLSTVLHEYESAKMEFFKIQIMRMLDQSHHNYGDGPVKVVVSQSGIDIEAVDSEIDAEFEPVDSPIVN